MLAKMSSLYITPMEAFALSGCSEYEFLERLNGLLQDGVLPSISRLNVLGSSLEPTPPYLWDRWHVVMLDGSVMAPQERLRPEHLRAEKGPIAITPGIVKPYVRIDVRFLRTDFIAAWDHTNPVKSQKREPQETQTLQAAIERTIGETWPKDIPAGTKPRDRNQTINEIIAKEGHKVPALETEITARNVAIGRALRHLRKSKST